MSEHAASKQHKCSYCAEIDCWRLLFACVIVLYHCRSLGKLGDTNVALFRNGWIATEFFFLVSGYLQAESAARSSLVSVPTASCVFSFWYKKWKRFFPYVLSSYIGLWNCMGSYAGFAAVLPHLSHSLGELSLTYMSGLGQTLLNRPVWYLSTLLVCSTIFQPLLKRHLHTFTRWIAPIAAVALLVWISRTDAPEGPFVWEGIAYRGLIRALGCMLMGIACQPVVQLLRQKRLCKTTRWLLFGLELCCFFIVLCIAQFGKVRELYGECIALFGVAIVIAFAGVTPLAARIPRKLGKWLSELSLSLFCSHWIVQYTLSHHAKDLMATLTRRRGSALSLALALLLSIAMMFWVKLLRGCATSCKTAYERKIEGMDADADL